MYFVQQKKISK